VPIRAPSQPGFPQLPVAYSVSATTYHMSRGLTMRVHMGIFPGLIKKAILLLNRCSFFRIEMETVI